MTEKICCNNNNSMKSLCRLCLVTDHTMTNMFTFSSTLGVLIADLVVKCATIHVIKDDDLPDSICGACFTELERIHQFQTMAVESNKVLRIRLQHLQSETQGLTETKEIGEFQKISEKNDSYQLNVKEENCKDASVDNTNILFGQEFKIESDFIIKDEPINDTEIYTTNEDIDDEETKWRSLESDDNINSDQMESSVPQFDVIEPYNEFRENKNMLKRHQCHICKERFVTRSQLTKHKSTHPKIQRFQCDQCKRVFKLRNHLIFHKMKHDKEQHCNMCEKRFKSRHILNAHKLTHTGERPYRCSLCKKTYKGSSALKNHMLWHSGDKPHQCRICDNQFRHPCNLRLHLSLVHGTQNI